VAVKLIADELILLAIYPANGGWPVGADGMPRPPRYVGPAVAVALLAELALMGVISVDGDRVLSTGREVRGQQELAGTAAMIMGESRARPAAWWGMRVAATAPERYRLEVLRRRTSLLAFEYPIRRILRSTSEPRWFVPEDNAAIVSAVDRMDHALRTRVADERTTALLALVHACELHRAYFKDRSRRERERQIRGLVDGHWVWRAAQRCVAAVDSAAR
jgi:hypothetical protein